MRETPSKKLFDEILKQGLGYIDDAITSKIVETYYLDFKTTEEKDYSGKRKLLTSDKKNYAKGISAFGNSEGGVIVWGIKTGASDADYATAKEPIKDVSNFLSLLEGFTSILTVPAHSSVHNQIIFEDESSNTGYVVTHIPRSNQRPLQVINENDFRYYIRAGSSSQAASDTFLRSLFGQEPQPNVFLTWGVSPVEIEPNGNIKIQAGILLHNRGENVAKNINGYVQVGGLGMALQPVTTHTEFSFYKNNISGLKIGYTSRPDFILGIEQEVQPVVMHININKPITANGIQILALVNASGQPSHRISIEIPRDELEQIYERYISDQTFDIAAEIFKLDRTTQETE